VLLVHGQMKLTAVLIYLFEAQLLTIPLSIFTTQWPL
jgi:uncharacterized membrane protein